MFLFFLFVSSKEIREGGKQLLEKLQKYRPRIAAFNGKCNVQCIVNDFLKHFCLFTDR